MNKDGKLSLVVKCGCHCTYTNENSDNGNQKATSKYGVSIKQNQLQTFYCAIFILASHWV